jgi:hypothetical protein
MIRTTITAIRLGIAFARTVLAARRLARRIDAATERMRRIADDAPQWINTPGSHRPDAPDAADGDSRGRPTVTFSSHAGWDAPIPCLCCSAPATGLARAARWRLPTCARHALRVVASAEVGEA